MPTVEEFAEAFPSEHVLQQALAKLLSKIPNHTGVQILQGSSELGKDIIFYTPGAFGQKDLNACVVKNTKITGSASKNGGARTVFNQAQQSLDTTLPDENGHPQRVKRVFIITPYPIPPETVTSISGAIRDSNDRVQFVGGASLLELFKLHWPGYLAEEFNVVQSYALELTEAVTMAKELEGLSFQYQLGTVDTSIKRVYVQPHFHRFLRSYSLQPLLEAFPGRFFMDHMFTVESVNRFSDEAQKVWNFISTVAQWGLCTETQRRIARTPINEFINDLTKAWSLAMSGRAARAKSGTLQTDSFAVRLSNVDQLNITLNSMRTAAFDALLDLRQGLNNANAYIRQTQPDAGPMAGKFEILINKLDEIARISGPGCMREEDEKNFAFTSTAVTNYGKSLFIVAPAGFGKTSFCRWHALNDLENLLQEKSSTLPVYVPLHQIGKIEQKDFKKAFLGHAGISALLPKDSQTRFERTRVYLDGLDEVATEEKQKRIAQLAQSATEADSSLQVIITARDYIYGPWMTWLPRIHLSGFDDTQVRELVSKWLDSNPTKVSIFFEQLEKSPSLKEMMGIPLLATLTVLVFKQTDKLPENKTRLYEMFVDLHSGGWDLAKGVQRPSRFSAAEKMYVLKRIAATIHKAKRREMIEEDVATVAKDALKKLNWEILRDELLRDGLVIQLGSMIGFAHHSFQEFLTAKYLLGDPNTTHLNSYCDEYLKGSEWWQEVLCFYVDLAGKPQETRTWLGQRLNAVAKHPNAQERAHFLKQHLDSSFPFAK
jgi:hypothetical protein